MKQQDDPSSLQLIVTQTCHSFFAPATGTLKKYVLPDGIVIKMLAVRYSKLQQLFVLRPGNQQWYSFMGSHNKYRILLK